MKRISSICAVLFFSALVFTGCEKTTTNTNLLAPVANAGPSQIIQLPVNTTTVTGSGTTTNNHITGYLWSLISGPNVPVINSPSSATTVIGNLIAGTYFLQFAVIDDAGLTGIDTLSILVKAAVTQTLTLQPSNNAAEVSISNFTAGPSGTDTQLSIGTWTISGLSYNWREMLKFDFSGIPAGANVLNATLTLYAMPNPHGGDLVNAHSGTTNAFYIERATANWALGTLTWANQPATSATNRVLVPQSTSANQDNTVDVTALVKDIQASSNFGFKFTLQNEVILNFRQYASSYHSNAALHPKLVITYL